MSRHYVRGVYLDPCHPQMRLAAVHGLVLVASLFAWLAIILGALAVWRQLGGIE